MKQILLAIAFTPFLLFSQIKQGEVIYKEVTKFEIPEKYRQYVPEGTPDTIVNEMILVFNETQSLYKTYENLDAEEEEPSQMKGMMSMWMGGDAQTYRNTETNQMIEKKDFQGKAFKITGKIQDTLKWKIMPSTKEILGFSTMLATSMSDSTEVKVWFTTEIPEPFGPMTVGGLPGLVLRMEFKADRFEMKVFADKFTDRTIKDKEFKLPKGGETVTQEEYDAIMKKKMEEMKKMRGEGGSRSY